MAVPSSGEITLIGIFSEKNETDYNAFNPDGETDFSLRGLSDDGEDDSLSLGGINLNAANTGQDQTAPHAMSEFYSYDHDLTTFTSVYSNFSISATAGSAGTVSSVKTLVVNSGTGAFTVNLQTGTGTLAVAVSSIGDPGTSGTANSGTGFVNEGTLLSHTPTSWGTSKTIYLRFRYSPHSSPMLSSQNRRVTHTNNGFTNIRTVTVQTK